MSESDLEFVADMEWLHSHDREAALPPDKLTRLFALARRGAAMQWRPIEEAPKDGTEVLVMIKPKRLRLGWYFKPSSTVFGWCDENGKRIYPTHFMPLPPPPEGEKE